MTKRIINLTNEEGHWYTMHQLEGMAIKAALKETKGSVKKAMELLRITPSTMNRKLKIYNINCRDYK